MNPTRTFSHAILEFQFCTLHTFKLFTSDTSELCIFTIFTFEEILKENGVQFYQQGGFACIYLQTVVDQKNLIFRRGRERRAYKNKSFPTLIRAEVFPPGGNETKSQLHAQQQREICDSTGSVAAIQRNTEMTTCHMCAMPH